MRIYVALVRGSENIEPWKGGGREVYRALIRVRESRYILSPAKGEGNKMINIFPQTRAGQW